jgi:Ni2+-binding GTPase involved in maturation of urease and hydrogenase
MRFITFSGPPSSGKTSVLLQLVRELHVDPSQTGVVKFDCFTTDDDATYLASGIDARAGFSGKLCPDHYFVSNVAACVDWGQRKGFDFLFTESAGLCNRCSPHIKTIPAVCVVDNLMGINTPRKIGPMLKMADVVVITKGDIVSQAEREIFALKVRETNPRALIMHMNGITGQGAARLGKWIFSQHELLGAIEEDELRFAMPSGLCSYCMGETRVGKDHQMGNLKPIKLDG